jgi:predicted ATPase
MLGLNGAHRTGKSTLAREYAKRHDILYVETRVTDVFKQLGLDPRKTYEIDQRLMIQEAVLTALTRQYKEAAKQSRLFVADRTPIDLASYMLADVTGSSAPSLAMAKLVNEYVRRCIEKTMEHFAVVVLIQPGIPIVDAPGKAAPCPAYMEHLNLIQRGLMADESFECQRFVMPRRTLDMEQRLRALDASFSAACEASQVIRKAAVLH